MTSLAGILREKIAKQGPISIACYMAEVLRHPEYGYYTSQQPFGEEGDFITAPEISQMFGELIAVWCAMTWSKMGAPALVNLVELGPGRGTMMKDLLRAAEAAPDFLKATRLHLLEISPAMIKLQLQALAEAPLECQPLWINDFQQLPPGPLLLVANEFFDALPIRQFQRLDGVWRERLIGCGQEGGLAFTLSKPIVSGPFVLPGLTVFPSGFPGAPEGAIIEACPEGVALAYSIAKRVAKQGGGALVIDYGHAKAALGETLQAVKRHAYHDVLKDPGQADLTAHVDFSALAFAASLAGGRVFGPIGQGEFLERLGVNVRTQALSASATPKQKADIETARRRLTDKDEMGALFKVMSIIAPGMAAPPGFDAEGFDAP